MMDNRSANSSWLWTAVAATILFAGCGPHPIPATGTVTLDGQPLDEAVILFIPLEPDRKKTGSAIEHGKYEVFARDGLLPGSYRVEIADNPPLDRPRAASTTVRRLIPYTYAHQSPLTAEVEPSTEAARFDFELTTSP